MARNRRIRKFRPLFMARFEGSCLQKTRSFLRKFYSGWRALPNSAISRRLRLPFREYGRRWGRAVRAKPRLSRKRPGFVPERGLAAKKWAVFRQSAVRAVKGVAKGRG